MNRWMMYAALAAALLGVAAVPATAVTIKLGTVAPEGSPWHDGLQEMAAAWQEISGGKVKVRIFPGGVAGDEPDLLRKIRIGQLHAAALAKSGLFVLVPDIDVLSFPLMVRTDEELNLLLREIGPRIERELEEKGLKVLNWSSAGWVHFFSREPVLLPEDLQKQKLFFWGSDPEYLELLKKAGVRPVPLSINDMLPSLQTGLVDAFASPPVVALSFQWFALTPYMADLRWQPLPGATVISLKTWNKIPADLRPRLEKISREIGKNLHARIAALNDEALQVMQEHGLQVNVVSEERAEYWNRFFMEKGGEEFIDRRYSRETYQRAKDILDEYRRSRRP